MGYLWHFCAKDHNHFRSFSTLSCFTQNSVQLQNGSSQSEIDWNLGLWGWTRNTHGISLYMGYLWPCRHSMHSVHVIIGLLPALSKMGEMIAVSKMNLNWNLGSLASKTFWDHLVYCKKKPATRKHLVIVKQIEWKLKLALVQHKCRTFDVQLTCLRIGTFV